MSGKMKILIFAVLISLIFTVRVHKKAVDDTQKNQVEEASRTVVGTEWIYLYNQSYRPMFSYSPVNYYSRFRTYFYYPYYSSYSYYPRSYFWAYYRKDANQETSAVDDKKSETPVESTRVEKKEGVENKKGEEKDKKIQIKVEELMRNMKKLKQDLWNSENYDTVELRKEKKAYDPEWLLTQLNISTVLQIEDLLNDNKVDAPKANKADAPKANK